MTQLNVLASSVVVQYLSAKDVVLLAFCSKMHHQVARHGVQEAMKHGVPSDSNSHPAIIAAPSFAAFSHYEHLSHSEFMFHAIRQIIHQISDHVGFFIELSLDDDAMTAKVADFLETPVHTISSALFEFSPTTIWAQLLINSPFLKGWGESRGNMKLVDGFLALWPRTVTQVPVPFSFAPALLCDMLERFLFPNAYCIFAVEKTTSALWVFETKTNFFILHMEID